MDTQETTTIHEHGTTVKTEWVTKVSRTVTTLPDGSEITDAYEDHAANIAHVVKHGITECFIATVTVYGSQSSGVKLRMTANVWNAYRSGDLYTCTQDEFPTIAEFIGFCGTFEDMHGKDCAMFDTLQEAAAYIASFKIPE